MNSIRKPKQQTCIYANNLGKMPMYMLSVPQSIQHFEADLESQPQNPEFRNNPENFHTCVFGVVLEGKTIITVA